MSIVNSDLSYNIHRIGFVGVGKHAKENLMPSLRLLPPNYKLVAVSSRKLSKAKQIATEWGVAQYTDNWMDLLSIVDSVIVSATPEVHFELAQACFEHRIHFFIEKPPTENIGQLQKLIKQEKDNPDVVGFVGFNFPYGDSYQALISIVQEQSPINFMKIKFISSGPVTPEYGYRTILESMLYSSGIHPINMVTRLFGRAKAVSATITNFNDNKLAVEILVEFFAGEVAVISLGNYYNRLEYQCEVINLLGSSGRLIQHNKLEFTNLSPRALDSNVINSDKTYVSYDWPSRRGGYTRTGYQNQFISFFNAIENNKISSSSLKDCLYAYEIIDSTIRSLKI